MRSAAVPADVLVALCAVIGIEVAARAARAPDVLPAIRLALAEAVEHAIDVMDALDALAEDLEEEPDLEDGADLEAVDEDGDPLDHGEADGWRRPRRTRVSHTEWPIAFAERERRRAAVIAAVVRPSNVVRFPGGRHV